MTHRAWLIDLDGTLYRPLPVKLLSGLELALLGFSHLASIRIFRSEHERLREELTEAVASPFEVQLERTAAKAGLTAPELDRVVRAWMVARPAKWIRLFARKSLLAEIRAFRAAGGKTALVSDYPARTKLKALGAEGLFDAVVANGEEGGPARLKPWPDGYLKAAELLNVPPAECLIIGDRDDADGEAARRAGCAFRQIH